MKEGDIFQEEFQTTEAMYQGFIEIFKDKNPMHTQKAYAQERGYDDVILHGNILCGFLSYFIGECLPIKNVMIIGQQIDFHRPFFKGDNLDFVAKIKNISAAVGIIEFRFSFKNELREKIAKGSIQIKEL